MRCAEEKVKSSTMLPDSLEIIVAPKGFFLSASSIVNIAELSSILTPPSSLFLVHGCFAPQIAVCS